VQFVLRLRNYALQASGIDVRADLDPSAPVVEGDDPKLQQVVLNLLINAEDAMRSSPTKRLVVRTTRGLDARLGELVTIEVTDSGKGMNAETRERIFEPFFTTKPAGSGTGLGLSLSYGIVEAHGGSIAVESEPGRGTTFRISLPMRRGTVRNGGETARSA
jgi:signal transduction histidine kinase